MRPHELESKVLGIVERVQRKQPVEDALVELKRQWIDAKKAGRQLAGSCNAARGDPVLWIIGIDEDKGVIGASEAELSNWWAQVRSKFDQMVPELTLSLAVPVGAVTVMALLIDTSRAPFVVTSDGGQVGREVPWREGNCTRSATRQDLLRVLAPIAALPDVDLIPGSQACAVEGSSGWRLVVAAKLFVVPNGKTTLVAHKSTVQVRPSQMMFRDERCQRAFEGPSSDGVAITGSAAVLTVPGGVSLSFNGPMLAIGPALPPELTVQIGLAVVGARRNCLIELRFQQTTHSSQRVVYSAG